MKALRPLRNLKHRREFRADQFDHLVPDRAHRRGGFGAGQPLTLPFRGERRPAHLKLASETPLPAASPRGGNALPAHPPAQGMRRHQSETAGPAPQPGPAVRSPRLGMFDCDTCGTPIGRGHADDCPKARPSRSLTDWIELTVCLVAFGTAAALAAWLRAPEIAALAVALAVLAWAAYRPPARGQVRRSQPPSAPAHRAAADREVVRSTSGGARPRRRRAQGPSVSAGRMARSPLGPPRDPTDQT